MGEAKLYGKSGGGMKIDGIIADYYAYAGQNISAGDFVEFINGIANSDVKSGAENIFQTGLVVNTRAELIDSNKVFIAYHERDNDMFYSFVATISGMTVTLGTKYTLNGYGANAININKLSSTKVVLTFDSGNYVYAVVATISGTTITFGTTTSCGTGYKTTDMKSCLIDTNKVLIAFKDITSNYNYGRAICATISDSTVIFGSSTMYIFNKASTDLISLLCIEKDKIIIGYTDIGNSNYGAVIIGTVSGTSITFGSEYVFNSAATYLITMGLVSDNKVIIAFQDRGRSNYGIAIVATISGTSALFGSEYVFRRNSAYIYDICSIFENVALIAHGQTNGLITKANVLGDIIAFGEEYSFREIATYDISLCSMFGSHLLACYTSASDTATRDGGACVVKFGEYETQVRKATLSTFNGVAKTSGTGGTDTTHGGILSVYVPNI